MADQAVSLDAEGREKLNLWPCLWRALSAAFVIGILMTLLTQFEALAALSLGQIDWVHVSLSVFVPFCVTFVFFWREASRQVTESQDSVLPEPAIEIAPEPVELPPPAGAAGS